MKSKVNTLIGTPHEFLSQNEGLKGIFGINGRIAERILDISAIRNIWHPLKNN